MKLWKIRARWWILAAMLILIAAGGIALYARINAVDYKADVLLAELRNEPPGFFEGWLIKFGLKDKRQPRDPEKIVADLVELGPDAVPYLIEAMPDDNSEVRLAVVKALETLGPEAKTAVPALIGLAMLGAPDAIFLTVAVPLEVGLVIDGEPEAVSPAANSVSLKSPSRHD